MMEQNTSLGTNKTGIDMSPILAKEMMEGNEQFLQEQSSKGSDSSRAKKDSKSGSGNGPKKMSAKAAAQSGQESLSSFDRSYLEDADPLGSVPLPGTVKGAVKSVMKMATGRRPEVFINKLGERLAFERSGVRIYEQLINKCEYGDAPGGTAIPLDQVS